MRSQPCGAALRGGARLNGVRQRSTAPERQRLNRGHRCLAERLLDDPLQHQAGANSSSERPWYEAGRGRAWLACANWRLRSWRESSRRRCCERGGLCTATRSCPDDLVCMHSIGLHATMARGACAWTCHFVASWPFLVPRARLGPLGLVRRGAPSYSVPHRFRALQCGTRAARERRLSGARVVLGRCLGGARMSEVLGWDQHVQRLCGAGSERLRMWSGI